MTRRSRRSVALDPDMLPELKAEAKRLSTSVAAIIRQAVLVHLSNVRKQREGKVA